MNLKGMIQRFTRIFSKREEESTKNPTTFNIIRKIAFAFFFILLLMGAMLGIILHFYHSINEHHVVMQEGSLMQRAVVNLKSGTENLIMSVNDYIITGKDLYRSRYEQQHTQIDLYEQKLRLFNLSSEELFLLDSISNDLDSIYAYANRIFAIPGPPSFSNSEAAALMERMDYTFGKAVEQKAAKILHLIYDKIERNKIFSWSMQKQMLKIIYIILFISLLISITIVHQSVKKFSKMAKAIEVSHRKLELSKRFTENIVATVPSALIVINRKSKVIFVNCSFCELFNVKASEVVGVLVHRK